MAQVYMFTEELGKAVKSCKCHSVNEKIFSSEDKKKVEKGETGQLKRKGRERKKGKIR